MLEKIDNKMINGTEIRIKKKKWKKSPGTQKKEKLKI